MKFSGYVDYGTRNNLEDLGYDAFNLLHTGFIFIFFWVLVFFSNITEERMNGYSSNPKEMDTRSNWLDCFTSE